MTIYPLRHALGFFFLLSPLLESSLRADSSLSRKASWSQPKRSLVEEMIKNFRPKEAADATLLAEAMDFWTRGIEGEQTDLLEASVGALARLFPEFGSVIEEADKDTLEAFVTFESLDWPEEELPSDSLSPQAALRTWLGRKLVQNRYYDEALVILAPVEASQSPDPSSVLFYRAVCRHALLLKDEALFDLKRLLENEADSPIRFVRTAKLMISDLSPLKEDTLDEISRLMTNVTRHLDLGRSGNDVLEKEQGVIDKLDKLIADLEKQQEEQDQQQQAASGSSKQGKQGESRGMKDSQIAEAQGKGDVDRKSPDEGSGWGNLPPAERAESLQQISRDLPTHYREAIEAYFRKIATDQP